MTKARTNALDALRALIAERQQYEQWLAALEEKKEGTAEHVYERVQADYRGRLDRVITEIRGHSEELQNNISTLSSKLVEVAREEDTRREGLQEAELRAAVGEYQPAQWEQLKSDAEREIERIAADRESLDGQLSELRAIQKLSEVGSTQAPETVPSAADSASFSGAEKPVRQAVADERPERGSEAPAQPFSGPVGHRAGTSASTAAAAADAASPAAEAGSSAPPATPKASPDQTTPPLEASAAKGVASTATPPRGRSGKTPPGGVAPVRSRTEAGRPDQAKTLKCPECGTANYPTEWYCERCGGELATM